MPPRAAKRTAAGSRRPRCGRHHAGRGGGGAHAPAPQRFPRLAVAHRRSRRVPARLRRPAPPGPFARHAPGAKRITDAIEPASSDFYRGLLRGLFDADGSVQGSQEKGVSVRLTQTDREQPRARAAHAAAPRHRIHDLLRPQASRREMLPTARRPKGLLDAGRARARHQRRQPAALPRPDRLCRHREVGAARRPARHTGEP